MTRKRSESKSESSAGARISVEDVERVERAIFSAKTYINMSIYAILELPQELYFGSHTEKDLNVLETVKIVADVKTDNGVKPITITKGYFSPTKQRGIERRAIAYSLVCTSNGCMPYYRFFNLSIDITDTYVNGIPDPRDILTFLWGASWTSRTSPTVFLRGRVGYGGGVAVQPITEIKQRNRVHYNIYAKTEKEEKREKAVQTLWRKEYLEPGVLIPVVRHGFMLGVENFEPHAVAYAFLEGLKLVGAGTPKGIDILRAYWRSDDRLERVIVVDIYAWLSPEPVTISPVITSVIEALEIFRERTSRYDEYKGDIDLNNIVKIVIGEKKAVRLVGDNAYNFLRNLADEFGKHYLGNIEQLNIPRINVIQQKQ